MNAIPCNAIGRGRRHCPWLFLGSVALALALSSRVDALTFIPTFEPSITTHPQAATIMATINSAMAVYQNNFSDPVTIYVRFKNITDVRSSLVRDLFPTTYTAYQTALQHKIKSLDDAVAFAHLPNTLGNPVNGSTLIMALPLARALGFPANPPLFQPDGTIGLNLSVMNLSSAETDPAKFSLFSEVSHKLNILLGIESSLDGDPTAGPVCPEDLFRYDAAGSRSYTTDPNAVAFFSIDGTPRLVRLNQQGLFYGDWDTTPPHTPQVQDAIPTPGAAPVLGVELRVLDVLGYSRMPEPVWVDFSYSSPVFQYGTYDEPYSTLVRGAYAITLDPLNLIPPGGTLIIKAGVSHETLCITNPMTIVTFGGPATIGQ